jgi:hypothetical protein
MTDENAITHDTLLPFAIELFNGSLTTFGDAEAYLAGLGDRQRASSHWRIAIQLLDHALRDPGYLKAATMSLQTALALDGLRVRMRG